MDKQAVPMHPKFQGSVPVFTGTRVPVKNLFGYLEAGEPLEQFPIDFPALDRAKAIAALETGREVRD